MEATVTRVSQKDLKKATSKRMLVRIMKLLRVETAKLEQFHNPHEKAGRWVWMLVSHTTDPKRKVPIYFSVDQDTMETRLSVTRKSKKEIAKWELLLPTNLSDLPSSDEILQKLGF